MAPRPFRLARLRRPRRARSSQGYACLGAREGSGRQTRSSSAASVVTDGPERPSRAWRSSSAFLPRKRSLGFVPTTARGRSRRLSRRRSLSDLAFERPDRDRGSDPCDLASPHRRSLPGISHDGSSTANDLDIPGSDRRRRTPRSRVRPAVSIWPLKLNRRGSAGGAVVARTQRPLPRRKRRRIARHERAVPVVRDHRRSRARRVCRPEPSRAPRQAYPWLDLLPWPHHHFHWPDSGVPGEPDRARDMLSRCSRGLGPANASSSAASVVTDGPERPSRAWRSSSAFLPRKRSLGFVPTTARGRSRRLSRRRSLSDLAFERPDRDRGSDPCDLASPHRRSLPGISDAGSLAIKSRRSALFLAGERVLRLAHKTALCGSAMPWASGR